MQNLIKDTTKFLRLLVEYHVPGTALKGVRNVIVEKESDVEVRLREGILLDFTKAPVEKIIFKIIRNIGAAVENKTAAAPCINC